MCSYFSGLTGNVTINSNGTRLPLYMVYALDTNAKQQVFAEISFVNETNVVSLKKKSEEMRFIYYVMSRKF